MNPKHAQYMLTVYQEGSITSAAKKLYVSQPSLSQMIKLVESNLGTPIFNRSTDPLTLTYAGEKSRRPRKFLPSIPTWSGKSRKSKMRNTEKSGWASPFKGA